jgi:hypothetical protein
MINSENTIRAALDCDTIAADQGGRRHLVVTIQAPPAPSSNGKPPLPLNVALVIDASGSMDAEDSFPGMISLPPEPSLDGYEQESLLPNGRPSSLLAVLLTTTDYRWCHLRTNRYVMLFPSP